MSSTPQARKRHPRSQPSNPSSSSEDETPAISKAKPSQRPPTEGNTNANTFTLLDILRILGGVLLLSSLLSYLTTSGDSWTWGYTPWFLRLRPLLRHLRGPLNLTDAQLSLYNGTDASLPILLALNGSIYDVSSNPGTYGPDGGYAFFTGRDAARAFITGCFEEDLTPDLRGVEEMFVPVDEDEAAASGGGGGKGPAEGLPASLAPNAKPSAEVVQGDTLVRVGGRKGVTKAELKIRRERDVRVAKKKMREALEGWHKVFRGDTGKDYFWVGTVQREEGWLERLPKRELCENGRKSRPLRKDVEKNRK